MPESTRRMAGATRLRISLISFKVSATTFWSDSSSLIRSANSGRTSAMTIRWAMVNLTGKCRSCWFGSDIMRFPNCC